MPLNRKELLATLEVHGDEPLYHYAIVRGNTIIESGQAQPHELASMRVSKQRYALLCPDAVFGSTTVTVPSKNSKIIDLMVRRNVDQDIHLGSDYTLLHNITNTEDGKSDFDYLAVSANDTTWINDHIHIDRVPVQNICLVEQAICALIHRACKDPVIAFWAKDNKLIGLLLANNQILARRLSHIKTESLNIEFDTGLELEFEDDNETHSHYKDALNTMHNQLSSIAKNNHYIEDYIPIALGDLLDEKGLDLDPPESQALAQSIMALYKIDENNTALNEALRNPQLYGLSHVSSAFNLCPIEYQHQVRSFNIGFYTAPAFALVGGLLLCSAAFTGYNNYEHRSQLEDEITRLTPSIDKINSRAPNAAKIKELKQTTQLLKREQLLLRTDNFLNWVSHIFLGHAKITSLYISPEKEKRKQKTPTKRKSVNQQPSGRYKVSIEADINSQYAKGKMTAENLVWALGLRSEIVESSFRFDAELTSQPKGQLSVSFIAQAKDFLELR